MFGSGKTTLASRLIVGDTKLLAERHEDNPFWANDAATERVGYLAYDLAFLLHHIDLVTGCDRNGNAYIALCDWSFTTDLLWASMRLGSDFAHYRAVHHALAGRVGLPIGWLYLRQPPEVILERLVVRGRKPERQLAEHVVAGVTALEDAARSLPPGRVTTVHDDTTLDQLQSTIDTWMGRLPNG